MPISERKTCLPFVFQADQLRLEFDATVDGDAMTGTIEGAGGAFSFTFTAQRTGTRAGAGAEIAQAAGAPPEAEAQPQEEQAAESAEDGGEAKP